MSDLDKYSTPIVVGDQPLGDSFLAYKMDSTLTDSNMRNDVGIGTCNCCDYFLIENDCVYLIEETAIICTYKDLASKYSDLEENLREKLIYEIIRDENRMKVYGSMLVLCRLASKFENVSDKLKDKPAIFFLVVSAYGGDDAIFFEGLRSQLISDLKSLLTAELVQDVEILDSSQLKLKLLSSPNTQSLPM